MVIIKKYWWWGVVMLVGLVITLTGLGKIPAGFYWDEAAFGYYGYSLLKFGTDEFGNKWPVYFKSIGDYKYPLYAYLSSISVAITGLNIFSARLISALAGVATIVTTIFFLKVMFKKSLTPLLAVVIALMFFTTPWYLLFARTAREAMLGLFFSTLGLFLIQIDNWQNIGWKKTVGLMCLWLLAMLSYSAYRLFIPVTLLICGGLKFLLGKPYSKEFKGAVLTLIMGLVLTIDPGSRMRAEGVFNLVDSETVRTAQSQMFEVGMVMRGKSGALIARIFDNKYSVKALEWWGQYLKHFDLSYLFVTSNPKLSWYTTPGAGLLSYIALPLILVGFFYGLKELREKQEVVILISMILVGAIAPAITIESPDPIRQLPSLPAFLALTAIGLITLNQNIRVGWLRGMFLLMILVNASFNLKQFFIHREVHIPYYTNQGFKEVVHYLETNADKYKAVVMQGDPYIYFLFWGTKNQRWQPKEMVVNDKRWGSVDRLDNLVFLMPYDCPKIGKTNVLYVCQSKSIPLNARVKMVSYFKNGEPAYALINFFFWDQTMKVEPVPEKFERRKEIDTTFLGGVIPENDSRLWL